jgi:hypothetical protein
MNWRYCDPARGRFTVRVAERNGKILGYLVFKISEGSGYIVDLLALPGRIDESQLEFLTDSTARIHLTHGDADWI